MIFGSAHSTASPALPKTAGAMPKGKPKFLLSGLLRCGVCGGHFVIANRHEYHCWGDTDGRSCSNGVRVRRLAIEESILGPPVRRDLLSPERAAKMAKEIQSYYLERAHAMQERASEAPKKIQDITARILRLSERLKNGDPDMAPDEIEAAIITAEQKRQLQPNRIPGMMLCLVFLTVRSPNTHRYPSSAVATTSHTSALSNRR